MATRVRPDLGSPRGEAARELAALVANRQELDARLDELDRQQREASEHVARLSAELTDLERAAAAGGQVGEAARGKAEQALTQARIAASVPWAERRAGVNAAARDADHVMTAFVAEHLDELVAELHEDAEAAAEAVNRACRAVEAAYYERQAVEQRVTTVAAMVRVPRPGDVRRTKAEAVVRETNRLLAEGGEQAPTLTVDPRKPRHGETITETEQPAA